MLQEIPLREEGSPRGSVSAEDDPSERLLAVLDVIRQTARDDTEHEWVTPVSREQDVGIIDGTTES